MMRLAKILLATLMCLAAELSPSLFAEEPFLQGQITDESGRPIQGATVYIADCIGTCYGGVGHLTDDQGRYTFDSKPFRNYPSLSASMPGRYVVSEALTGPKLHEPDGTEPRVANFVLGTPASVSVRVEGDPPEGWERSVYLNAGNDAKTQRDKLTGVHSEGWNTWWFPTVQRNERCHVVVIDKPTIPETKERDRRRELEREADSKRVETISAPIRLVDPMRHTIELEQHPKSTETLAYLTIQKITDAIHRDRTDELSVTDPMFGKPVSANERERALLLLQQVGETAMPWNGHPPKSITQYEYNVTWAEKPTEHVIVTKDTPSGPSWNDISRLRGFAYMPPLRWLFSQPQNIEFYSIAIDAQQAELIYRLKQSRGFSFGLGVGPGWHGFFSRSFAAGKIKIDPQRNVVLEHRLMSGPLDKEAIETFSDYVKVGDQYAPLQLRIQNGQFDTQIHFKIHHKKLWLVDHAKHASNEATYRISDVVVKAQ